MEHGLEGEVGAEWRGLGWPRKSMRVTQGLITPSKPRAPHCQGQYDPVILEAGITDSLGI